MRLKPGFLLLILLLLSACSTATPTLGPMPSPTVPSPTPLEAPAPSAAATTETSFYVPPQCQGAPIATLLAPATEPGTPPTTEPNPTLSAEQQMTVMLGLANAVADHYQNPDAVSDVWLARMSTAGIRIEAGLETEAFYAEMAALVSALGDEHSYFQTPQDVAEEDLSGELDFVGVGALFQPAEDEASAAVLAVLEGGAAWQAGIQPHDALLAVDGGPIRGPSGRSRTLGPECSAVVLTIQRPGQQPRDLTLIRSGVSGSLPIYPTLVSTSDGSRIGYVFLPTLLDESLPERLRQALEDFGTLDGLIIDNRMNGGGLGSVTNRILGFFASGHVGDFVTREGAEPLEITADRVHNSQEVPLIVLVGEDTVSYGEILSGILRDVGRARIVGETTLGNVEQLRRFGFEDGSRAWLAASRFEPANSQADWETTGIVPDVEVIAEWTTFTFETDPAVAAALALLGHE